LARLALLKPRDFRYHVFIYAVEKSIGFYRRFGFTNHPEWQDEQGVKHPSGHLILTPAEIYRCRKLLKKHNVALPEAEYEIPFQPMPARE
jgi:hypothetical protein